MNGTPEYAVASWAGKYVGLSYEQADCWALIRLVFSEQWGIEIPPDPARARRLFRRVDRPEAEDVVTLRTPRGPHIAMVVAHNRILHTAKGKNAVIERIDGRQVAGCFRYQGARE